MNKTSSRNLLLVIALFTILATSSCTNNKTYIPKPTTYLKLDLPPKDYVKYTDSSCSISFEIPSYFSVKNNAQIPCNKDIDLGPHNGSLHLSHIKMDTSLSAYINYALDKIDEHKIKASAILDTTFIHEEKGTYGTLFELQGNVASPFHFYLTDSSSTFLSGVVYFNSRPNYDSIKPVLNYVRKDLVRFMQSAYWK